MSTFSTGRITTTQRLGRWALLTAMFVLAMPAEAHAEAKFAVIDLRRAVADTEDGLRVQAKLQQLFDSRQSEYEAKEKTYKKLKLELEKLAKEGKTPQATLRKKYESLEKFALELQSASVAYRREMQQQENAMMYPIIKELLVLVRRVAGQNGYDMVLNKESVPYFRSDLDITDRVIQMYNTKQTGGEPANKNKKSPAPKQGSPAAPKGKSPQ